MGFCLINHSFYVVQISFCVAVIAAVHAELQLQSPGGADVTESKIVSQSEVRLCIECDEPQNLQTKKLLAEINGKLAELNVDPNKLILRKGNSILCCFVCSSEEQLQQLRYLYESGAMKRVLEDVFTVLSDDDESIAIRELRWNLEEYNDSVQRLNLLKALGL